MKGAELQAILDHAGSFKRFKEMMGIDEQTFRRYQSHFNLTLRKLDAHTPIFIAEEVKRIGSVELFCIIYRCKPSELHTVMSREGFSLKQLVCPVGATSGIGRKGENFFKTVRGSSIIEDCFETRGHTCEFDFLDKRFGLVNVKTASRQRWTAKTRAANPNYWDFSTKGHLDCDTLALVPLDAKGEPLMVLIVPSLTVKGMSHLTVTGRDIRAASPVITYLDGEGCYFMFAMKLEMFPQNVKEVDTVEQIITQ